MSNFKRNKNAIWSVLETPLTVLLDTFARSHTLRPFPDAQESVALCIWKAATQRYPQNDNVTSFATWHIQSALLLKCNSTAFRGVPTQLQVLWALWFVWPAMNLNWCNTQCVSCFAKQCYRTLRISARRLAFRGRLIVTNCSMCEHTTGITAHFNKHFLIFYF